MRALHPNLFEMERTKQDEGRPSLIDSLRPDTEQDLFDIQIAEILHVPAPLIPRLPLHWVGSAMTLLDARARIAEAQRKRVSRG